MTRLALLVACVALLAVLPYGSAGPACAKKYWQQQDCIQKCKSKWGYPGSMMGTDRWGSVMQKTDASTEAWNAGLAKACGVEPSDTLSGVQGKVAGQTSSSSSSFSSSVTSSSSATFNSSTIQSTSTSSSSSQIASSTSISSERNFLPSTFNFFTPTPTTTSSSSTEESTTSTEQETTSEPPPPPPTTTEPPPPTTTSEPPPPPPTTTSEPPPPPPTTSSTQGAAPTQDSNDNNGNNSGGSSSGGDIDEFLQAHNSIRAQHGAQPLTWSDEAASKAQQWANNCKFEHSGGSLGPFGENLAAGTSDSYSPSRAVKGWTDEVSDYDPNNPKASHFTQVVWKATTQVGCALAICDGLLPGFGKARYYVCEYTPQGNVGGQFAANVQA